MVEAWHAAAMLSAHDEVRVRRFSTPEGSREDLGDRARRQLEDRHCRIHRLSAGADGRWIASERYIATVFPPRRAWLTAGERRTTSQRWLPGYDDGPITKETGTWWRFVRRRRPESESGCLCLGREP